LDEFSLLVKQIKELDMETPFPEGAEATAAS